MFAWSRNRNATAAVLLALILAGCSSPGAPLWPGSNYTERERSDAIMGALAYIHRSAGDPANFGAYGHDYLHCFYSIANSARDPALRTEARRVGREAAKRPRTAWQCFKQAEPSHRSLFRPSGW